MTIQDFALSEGSARRPMLRLERPELSCVLVVSGGIAVTCTVRTDQSWRVSPGRGFILRSQQDYLLDWRPSTRLIVATVDEALVREFGASVDDETPLLAEESTLVAPALGFFQQTLAMGRAPAQIAAYALARLTEELVGSLLLERSNIGVGKVSARPSLYHQALALIAAQRAEPELSSESLAQQLSVSIRHLQRAFRDQGSSPSTQIRRQRVELATRLLTEARYRVLAIADVASYAGFRTVDDMRRAFRLEKRPAPSQIRAHADRVPSD